MSAEDMLAIQQGVARYSYTFDSGDCEGWANVFTEDGVWEYYAAGATAPATRLVGHAELRDFCVMRRGERREGVTSYHHQSGVLFDEVTTDSARVRCMLILTIQVVGEPARVYMTGVYEDQWVKTAQGWRIRYRVLRS